MALSKIVRDSLNTGIDDNSDATAITIDSSENVGIGATNPNRGSHDRALLVSNTGSGARSAIEIEGNSSNANGTVTFLNNGTSAASIDNRGSGTLTFNTGSSLTERLRIQAGGGISFNGDTASANALDDYETGTFTPSVSGGYGSAPSYNGQTGIYTKIGKLVLAHIRIAVASGSRGGSALTFVGLPFSNQSTIDGGGFVIYNNNFHSSGEFYPMVNASTAEVYFHEANGTSVTAQELDADNYDIRIALVYQTA